MITATFRSLLISDSDLAELVGTRIYPMSAPDTTQTPLIIYQRITETHDADTGLTQTRIQTDCYADTYDDVSELAQTVKTAAMHRTFIGSRETIVNITFVNAVDFRDPEARLYRQALDFIVSWKDNN